MPIYEYFCPACRSRFEKMRPLSDAAAPATCEKGHPAERAISAFAVGRGSGVQMLDVPEAAGGCCGGGACGCSN